MKPLVYVHPALLEPAAPAAPQWRCAGIAQALDGPGAWRLDDGRPATQAVSCLVAPEPGDQVLVLQAGDLAWITHVLARTANSARLHVPGIEQLAIEQASLRLEAADGLSLRCRGDVTLTSVQGSIAVTARHFLASIAETLVQQAQHAVTHAGHFVVQAAALLRVHGRQALLTADQDLKIDAERVTLG